MKLVRGEELDRLDVAAGDLLLAGEPCLLAVLLDGLLVALVRVQEACCGDDAGDDSDEGSAESGDDDPGGGDELALVAKVVAFDEPRPPDGDGDEEGGTECSADPHFGRNLRLVVTVAHGGMLSARTGQHAVNDRFQRWS
ncbi:MULTISPECIES: hypothetical protein [Streptomyces]|uniref:hypothetical protein n=1 Tax=Streptomyces TaxID=1883 RepID=UPI002E28C637|nr:hypothetical protein [Streptomyces sp. NBC_00271]